MVTGGRKGPVEPGAQIVDLTPIFGEPFGRGPRLQFGFGPLEEVPVMFSVAAFGPFALAPFVEPFEESASSGNCRPMPEGRSPIPRPST